MKGTKMDKDIIYALIHSPLVGPLTWKLVAEQMQQRNLDVVVPTLVDQAGSTQPFWKQHAESALAHLPKGQPVTLVGHSGAGPLLPAIGEALANPVHAYVFVDASIPRDGASRLDLMKAEGMEWAEQFQQELERGGRYPNWDFDDLREVIPDESLRKGMVAEIRPRGLSFFAEPIPVFDTWPEAPCVYIRLSAPYDRPAEQAQQFGWRTYDLEAGHFHMLVAPKTVTDMILEAVNKLV
jgi:hypothetical protein